MHIASWVSSFDCFDFQTRLRPSRRSNLCCLFLPNCHPERSASPCEHKSKDLCIFVCLQIRKPISSQVLPSGIHADDQLHLFHPRPALQLLFASSGSIYIFEPFPIYKPVKFVSAGEAFESTYLVLKHAIANVISNANVKILRAIRHYVNVEPFL